MALILERAGVQMPLPQYFVLDGRSLQARRNKTSRAYQHGAFSSGDKKYEARTIDIKGFINGTDEADYQLQLDSLMGQFDDAGRLYTMDNRYINLAGLQKWEEDFYDGNVHIKADVKFTLLALDPFFYTTVAQVDTFSMTTSPQQFTVNNPGNIDAPMVITITAAASCTSIILENVTDGGRLFTYTDVQMLTGQVLVVDNTGVGTVKRGTSNTINAWAGAFLNLLKGDNVFEYTGGACSIQTSFVPRWL